MSATGSVDLAITVRAVLRVNENRDDGLVAVTAAIMARVGDGDEQEVGRAGAVVEPNPRHVLDVEDELRKQCALWDIAVSPKLAQCRAADVTVAVVDWGDVEVLIPDSLLTHPDEGPPEFGPVWVALEAIEGGEGGDVVFVLAGDPTTRWAQPPDQRVQVRQA